MIFQVEEEDIIYGLVGVGSFATPAGFDNTILRPLVNEPQYMFNGDDLSATINPDDDLFFYNLEEDPNMDDCGTEGVETKTKDTSTGKPKLGKKSGSKSSDSPGGKKQSEISKLLSMRNKSKRFGGSIPWGSCIYNRTPKKRKKYCKANFKHLPSMLYKCQQDYCNFCCEKSVTWTNKLHLYTCQKQCNALAKNAKNKKIKKSWENVCLNVDIPNYSIYEYCDAHFKNLSESQRCKVDTCRLCCISVDEIKHTNLSNKGLNSCFKNCSKKFQLKMEDELEKLGRKPKNKIKLFRNTTKKCC